MTATHEEWRRRLAAAAERAAATLRQLDDPHVTALLQDLEALRARLVSDGREEAGASERTGPGAETDERAPPAECPTGSEPQPIE